MKYYFILLLTVCYALSLSAEDTMTVPSTSSYEAKAQELFQTLFSPDIVKYYAAGLIQLTESTKDANDLFMSFQDYLSTHPEILANYIVLCQGMFPNEEDLDVSLSLLHDPRYIKYEYPILMTRGQIGTQVDEILRTLISHETSNTSSLDLSKPIEITKYNFDNLLSHSEYLVIDVYTDWCGTCKYLHPIVQSLHEELGSLYCFASLNAEAEVEIASAFDLTAYPTILFIKNGVEVDRQVGFMNRAKFVDKLNRNFKP